MAGDEQKEVSRSWVERDQAAVFPLVNGQPRKFLETSSLGVVKKTILYFYLFTLHLVYRIHIARDIFISRDEIKS